ncbi:PorP/SprF family type IX secretion system membrane protein [Fluviicola taffensis]|uniref:Putative membrane protein n=1 Tax=Fluviicola taffensis (strain DSM 16823 / NCIMB 13979 / RW262) TaxID=755732 RepID=F2IHZ8_FLUTR|nr:PorP/SprF family type IX secretion system membrane protein [Fluviicola taffensis]AEA42698.1 putative membrane protein [Fluviicola taffensis DSM 16823]
MRKGYSYLLTGFFGLACSFSLFAQDIHFSHLNRQPIYQNPANTGLFAGDIRLTGNYKDQWRSVTVPFQTFAFAGDMKWKKKGINFGALFFHDNVGDGFYQTMEFLGSIAKNLKLTSDSSQTLSVGIQVGLNYRKVNMDKFYFDNQFNGLIFDASLPTNEAYQNDSRANVTSAAGVVHSFYYGKHNSIKTGLSGHNLNRPNQGFYGSKVLRDIRVSVFSQVDHALTRELAIVPGIGFNIQGKYRELILGSQIRYTLINKLGTYRAVDGGLWFRSRDAVVVRVGLAIQNWSVAISYDTNISKLIPASTARGGLEISAEYIITRFKPKKVIHRVCPDYI